MCKNYEQQGRRLALKQKSKYLVTGPAVGSFRQLGLSVVLSCWLVWLTIVSQLAGKPSFLKFIKVKITIMDFIIVILNSSVKYLQRSDPRAVFPETSIRPEIFSALTGINPCRWIKIISSRPAFFRPRSPRSTLSTVCCIICVSRKEHQLAATICRIWCFSILPRCSMSLTLAVC